MPRITSGECEAVKSRRDLTAALHTALELKPTEGFDGSEDQLVRVFQILSGIVVEYRDGGDQMADLCTCGEHND